MTDRDKAFSSATILTISTLILSFIFMATGIDLGWIFAIPPLAIVILASLAATCFYIGRMSRQL